MHVATAETSAETRDPGGPRTLDHLDHNAGAQLVVAVKSGAAAHHPSHLKPTAARLEFPEEKQI
jgi:hypothetical protein